MRTLVTVPWGERLGGAEAMLQTALEGSREQGQELEFVFLEGGAWPEELAAEGFHVEVIPAGRLRNVHLTVAAVYRLARVFRRRRPDLILNWSAKTHLYGSVAAMLVGMTDRVVWWQQAIPPRKGWLDRCATRLPARAIACYSTPAAEAQAQLPPLAGRLSSPRGRRRRTGAPSLRRWSSRRAFLSWGWWGACSHGRGRTACSRRRRSSVTAGTTCTC